MNLIEIGSRIKKMIKKTGLTQINVAKYLSLNQNVVLKIERGESKISSDIIEKLSCLFCCSEEYILFGNEEKFRGNILYKKAMLSFEDLKDFSIINKIVLNQFEMDEILEVVSND